MARIQPKPSDRVYLLENIRKIASSLLMQRVLGKLRMFTTSRLK